ncbi:Heterokaryon incompatibility protein Het-6OR allele [Fusarium acuminatum]|uniref:Heterokaryon incompatibility protein Het-6OR allele n=1 Tax=Fusarium acuminatum TaxID=5515 RepID=A0ABZ2XA75_9HYPO
MAPKLQYRPLTGNEIRVLKIEEVANAEDTTNNTKRQPIACSLEHVCLPPASKDDSHQQFKGRGRTWPELSAAHDTKSLFKDTRYPRAQDDHHEKESKGTVQDALAVDADLPWRYGWGDFIALSYVWGHPELPEGEPCHSITVDGCTVEVTPNLYYALTQLSQSCRVRQGFKLWTDAICIDQENADEKGQQIARMCDIYQLAWQVVIWLGPSDQGSALALSALYWLARESERPEPMGSFYYEGFSLDLKPLFIMWPKYYSPMKKKVYKALFHFFTRPYWRRMWVVQEVAMGNSQSPVICGDRCIAWEDVCKAVDIIAADESRLGREILDSVRPQILSTWSFEVARGRMIQGRTWAPERMWRIQQTMMQIQEVQKTDSSSNDWQGLVRALSLAQDSLVTNEKDRVYGILGIKAIAQRVQIAPNYKLSQSEIYTNFMSELISKGDLNTLRLASGQGGFVTTSWKFDSLPSFLQNQFVAPLLLPLLDEIAPVQEKTPVGTPCHHELPSWAICWTCAPAPTAQLGGLYHADQNIGHSLPVFSAEKSRITVKGLVLDTIISLSACNKSEADASYPLNSDDATLSSSSIYGDFEETKLALWRTIVGDTTSEGGKEAPEYYSWLLNPKLWQRGVAGVWTCGFGLHDFMDRNQQLRLCGYSLSELIFRSNKLTSRFRMAAGESYYNPTDAQREVLSWAINAMAWRRIFGTKGGRMGMGSCAAEVGDRIVILRGCNTPMILREVGNEWKLIGECYTHGVMYGEVSGTEHELADITIH